jgi:hypothetical protein
MSADCHLFPVYHLVCHTRVRGVNQKPVTLQVSHTLILKQQGNPEKPINCFLHLDIEYGCPPPVKWDVLPVQIWYHFHHELSQSALEDHGDVFVRIDV